MKQTVAFIVLLTVLLAACNRQSPAKLASLATPKAGLRADEIMTAQQVGAAILTARTQKDKDPGMQAVSAQMTQLNSGLDERARLLVVADAGSAPSSAKQASQASAALQARQQLDTNTGRLMDSLAKARAAVDSIGTQGTIAGLPSESFRVGIRASLDRLTAEVTKISKETGPNALRDIEALQQRLTLASPKPTAAQMTEPSIHVRLRPGRAGRAG
jgi:hypothetical protein